MIVTRINDSYSNMI